MLKRRLFLSFTEEKKWLDRQNAGGWELTRAAPFSYEFEKTGRRVRYEYIPVRGGRRGFDALDYKRKDSDAKAVYCKSDIALFKKQADKGAFTIQSDGEKRLAFARYRGGLWTRALVELAVFAIISMLASRFHAPVMYAPAALFLLASCVGLYKVWLLDKFNKKPDA